MVSKTLTSQIVKKFITARSADSRKGQNGSVLVVGGGYIYHGAPILSSLSALRSGCDLVYTAIPKIHASAARAISPDLIVLPLVDQKLTRGAVNKLLGLIPKDLDSATIGMGLAVAEVHALKILIKALLDSDIRLSLDAGALVGDVLDLLANKNVVITPHAGEFMRLFGQKPPDSLKPRIALTQKFAREYGITILLKGATDIIADSHTAYIYSKKIPAMTVGGTGDVLSGLVAGLLSKNRKPLESAAAAAFINGAAGKLAQKKLGLHMTATDLISCIPPAMKPFDKIK